MTFHPSTLIFVQVIKVIREIKENGVLLLALVRLWLQREQKVSLYLKDLIWTLVTYRNALI